MHARPVETHMGADNEDFVLKNKSLELRMHILVVDNHTETEFPNTVIALRIYLCLLISNCIKKQFLSCMVQTGKINDVVCAR